VYVSKDDYTIYTLTSKNEYNDVSESDFYDHKNLYIKFNNSELIGSSVQVNINRVTFKQTVTSSNTILVNRDINNDKRNILLYRNGRLVPQRLRKYDFSDKSTGPHRFKGVMAEDPNDEYTLIYNSNKYFMVYCAKTIDSKGVVDLTGKINKPIDFKWYDIYLNGLRLYKHNVEILGPYILRIKDVPTLTNLEIYQKNLDDLTWNNNYDTNDISSNIYNVIKDDIINSYPTIEDTIPDMFDDAIMDTIDFLNEYLYTLELINPDEQQITQVMIDEYPTVFDDNNVLFINPDELLPIEDNIFINPDTGSITPPKKTL